MSAWWEILGVAKDAPIEVCQQAYWSIMKSYQVMDDEIHIPAPRFIAVTKAYEKARRFSRLRTEDKYRSHVATAARVAQSMAKRKAGRI